MKTKTKLKEWKCKTKDNSTFILFILRINPKCKIECFNFEYFNTLFHHKLNKKDIDIICKENINSI